MTGLSGRRRRRAGRDEGFSLVELLVAMGIASVLMVAIGVVFLSTVRGVTTIDVKTATTADARITMEAMTRTLRVAFKPPNETAAFKAASTSDVTFYALIYPRNLSATATPTAAPDPTQVRYSYDGTCINQTVTPALIDATTGKQSWPSANGTTTCLARTAKAPAFYFYLTGTATARLNGGTGQVADDDLPLIRSVEIFVTAQDPSASSVTPVPLTNRVTLTNIAT